MGTVKLPQVLAVGHIGDETGAGLTQTRSPRDLDVLRADKFRAQELCQLKKFHLRMPLQSITT